MSRFAGVRVLVTGAADGIGAATAELFLAEGAKVLGIQASKITLPLPAVNFPIRRAAIAPPL